MIEEKKKKKKNRKNDESRKQKKEKTYRKNINFYPQNWKLHFFYFTTFTLFFIIFLFLYYFIFYLVEKRLCQGIYSIQWKRLCRFVFNLLWAVSRCILPYLSTIPVVRLFWRIRWMLLQNFTLKIADSVVFYTYTQYII